MTTRIVVECKQCSKEIVNGARLIVTLRVRVGLETRDLIDQDYCSEGCATTAIRTVLAGETR